MDMLPVADQRQDQQDERDQSQASRFRRVGGVTVLAGGIARGIRCHAHIVGRGIYGSRNFFSAIARMNADQYKSISAKSALSAEMKLPDAQGLAARFSWVRC